MKKWVLVVAMAAIAVVALLLFQTQRKNGDASKAADKLVMALDQGPVTLDPIKALDVGSGAFLPLIHAPLLLRAADGTARPILAESVIMADDGMSGTIRLKPNAQFWDGSPVTASDVIYSLVRFGRSGHPFAWAMNRVVDMGGTGEVSGLRMINDRTIEVRFSKPDPDWPWFIATPLVSIVNKDSADSPKENFDLQVIGAGPYRLADFDPGSSFRFVRNSGFPSVTTIENFEVQIVENPQRQLELVQRGQVNVVRLSGPMIGEATTVSKKDGKVEPRKSFRGVKLVSSPANEQMFVLLNLRSGPFATMPAASRAAFKSAMGSRLANPNVIEKLYGPFAQPVHSISPRIPFEPETSDQKVPTGMPTKARLLVPNSPDARRVASLVVAQAKELGLEFAVSHADLPDAVGKAISGEFDALLFWIASQPAHEAVPWSMFFDERTGFTALGETISGVGNDVENARGIIDETQRKAAYAELVRTLSAKETAWIPIASRSTLLMVPERLSGELLDWNGVPGFYGIDFKQ